MDFFALLVIFLVIALLTVLGALLIGYALLPFLAIFIMMSVIGAKLTVDHKWFKRHFSKSSAIVGFLLGGLLSIGVMWLFKEHLWAQYMGADRSIAEQRKINRATEYNLDVEYAWADHKLYDASRTNGCRYKPLERRYRRIFPWEARHQKVIPHCGCRTDYNDASNRNPDCLPDEQCRYFDAPIGAMCIQDEWITRDKTERPWTGNPFDPFSPRATREAREREEARKRFNKAPTPPPSTRSEPHACKRGKRPSYRRYDITGAHAFSRCSCQSNTDCDATERCMVLPNEGSDRACLPQEFQQ